MRVPLFMANWKMHKTAREARVFVQDLAKLLPPSPDREVVICPPFTALESAVSASNGRFPVCAQDLFWEAQGAFTGEISPAMLRDLGCAYVLVAHSERRQHFGETDQTARNKVAAALDHGLKPVLCVGETLREMESEKTEEVVSRQVREGLGRIRLEDFSRLALAYEPVWAIGTGKADSPDQSNKTIGVIRGILADLAGHLEAQKIRILYGGSVKPDNIAPFMAQPEIDGALVGGASLSTESFSKIVLHRSPTKA